MWHITLGWLMAIAPGLLYPALMLDYFRRFRQRTSVITQLLDVSQTRDLYLKTYRREQASEGRQWHGTVELRVSAYLLPVTACALLAIAGTAVCLTLAEQDLGLPAALVALIRKNVFSTAVAGFAGAYVWGLYDILERFRILNWTPNHIHTVYFRLILGPILGSYVAVLANATLAPLVAFAIAAFPAGIIQKWLQAQARDRLNILRASESSVSPMWELIQGLTPDIVDRLIEAGVTSVAHLANQDPVSLLRRTNIDWRNILDMMDQAYLAMYVGDKIEKLRASGIRGSIEMAILAGRQVSGTDSVKQGAAATTREVAKALERSEEEVRNLMLNLSEDSQVQMLWRLWWDRDEKAPPVG